MEQESIIKIQKWYENIICKRIRHNILDLVYAYERKLKDKVALNRFSEYEKAFGFTQVSRSGARVFSQHFGSLMERILCCGFNHTLVNNVIDIQSADRFYEIKSRHDTVKQSQMFSEIRDKIIHSGKHNKTFALLIVIDKNNMNRIMPLHQYTALRRLVDVPEYDQNKHIWISGEEVYNTVFTKKYGLFAKAVVLNGLHRIRIS